MKLFLVTKQQQNKNAATESTKISKIALGHFKLDQRKRDVNRTSKVNGARLLI